MGHGTKKNTAGYKIGAALYNQATGGIARMVKMHVRVNLYLGSEGSIIARF